MCLIIEEFRLTMQCFVAKNDKFLYFENSKGSEAIWHLYLKLFGALNHQQQL
jgi:hypothetical protein